MEKKQFKGPLDYIDVASRIVEFREKYPQGSLQQIRLEFVNINNRDWVVYTAAAYRGPEDTIPGIGTAWEPIPGPTPYTKDSEVQNAETAAWGRAMVAALAVDTRKGIASSEEVRNRQQAPTAPRDFLAIANALVTAKDLDGLRVTYQDAERSKAPMDVLAKIAELAATLKAE